MAWVLPIIEAIGGAIAGASEASGLTGAAQTVGDIAGSAATSIGKGATALHDSSLGQGIGQVGNALDQIQKIKSKGVVSMFPGASMPSLGGAPAEEPSILSKISGMDPEDPSTSQAVADYLRTMQMQNQYRRPMP